jgi:dTDP-4-dehydrorhamnose 3,5-epimerase
MSRFTIESLPLLGLQRVERKRMGDDRGFLSRIFCAEELALFGWNKPVSQINHTHTVRCGTVRGLHFQRPPHAEMKLVSCLRGEVWDVAVDLRAGSPTFLRWHAETLSGENGRALLIPEGFAHGFQTLSDDVEMLYCHSQAYAAQSEGGLHPLDPRLALDWPLAVTDMSHRDSSHPFMTEDFKGVQA